jgi:hypothetical protein
MEPQAVRKTYKPKLKPLRSVNSLLSVVCGGSPGDNGYVGGDQLAGEM